MTELKTAHDAVDYAIYMSTQWCHDEQFFKLVQQNHVVLFEEICFEKSGNCRFAMFFQWILPTVFTL